MIKFNLINSYTENLFFFVSNLSEFHFSCRKEYNEEWQRIFGELSKTEKIHLKNLSVVLKNNGFDGKNPYLGIPFFLPSESRKIKSVKEILDEKEFSIVEKTLEIFRPKFQLIYKKDKLDDWIKIQSEIFKSDRVQNAVREVSSLLGAKMFQGQLNIHLLGFVSPKILASGGANLGPNDITLEMPVNKIEDWVGEWGVFVALHELTHLFFENSKAQEILKKKTKKIAINKIKKIKPERDVYNLMKEIMTELCAPSGYICEKNSKKIKPLSEILITNLGRKLEQFEKYKKNKDVPYHDLSSYIVWQTYPLVSLYVNNKMTIDSKFVDYLLEILKAGD